MKNYFQYLNGVEIKIEQISKDKYLVACQNQKAESEIINEKFLYSNFFELIFNIFLLLS